MSSANIRQQVSLKAMNTFGIPATAKYFAEATTTDALFEILQSPFAEKENLLVLGGGSNILFTKDWDGLVLKNSLNGIEVVSESDTHIMVKAAAGENWHQLVLWCIARNYGGIENLSLIPGLCGAAPMQNIGAYGVELKDVFHSLEAVEIAGKSIQTFSNNDCGFGYRESVFKNRLKGQFIITSITLQLTKPPHRFHTAYGDIQKTLDEMQATEMSLKVISDAVIKIRSSKLPSPSVLGNAGSFFKNPVVTAQQFESFIAAHPGAPHYKQTDDSVKIPAGWLIEQAGWKGKMTGNAGVHSKQALVLVNYGFAKGSEVLELAKQIRADVFEKFGIELIPEVNVV